MYSLKKMTQKISKTYTLSFPKAAHSLEAQDQGASPGSEVWDSWIGSEKVTAPDWRNFSKIRIFKAGMIEV